MILINEITESQFRLYDFKFVIGDYATYNSYFKIVLETSEIIGLQTVTGGIKPSAEIFNNKLILIAGNNFYIYDLDGKIIRQFTSDCIFYEFIIYKNNILVVSELSIFLLNYDFVKIWSNNYNEIIYKVEMQGTKIVIQDYNKKIIYIDYFTGKEV